MSAMLVLDLSQLRESEAVFTGAYTYADTFTRTLYIMTYVLVEYNLHAHMNVNTM